ncbi:hypothetical protein [Streptomyces stackebrandtii]|uniref:hypothetical protein n=1 Tax=Streptomyces stackebrandtii TaxID=3051177 RepID=UPI0037DA4BA7
MRTASTCGCSLGRVLAELHDGCAKVKPAVPRLTIEPGRAVVGPAGVCVYRVLSVKRTGSHTFVAVDGGMSDNPRPALYGVRCSPRLIGRYSTAAARLVTVVGRRCEAGVILADEVPHPRAGPPPSPAHPSSTPAGVAPSGAVPTAPTPTEASRGSRPLLPGPARSGRGSPSCAVGRSFRTP